MQKMWTHSLFYLGSLFACGVMALSSGCASGGFKLTRDYARWVNSQNIIIRIVLYILTFVVFGVTLLIDAVVFNTMDFWQGRVSEGKYQFSEEGRTYQVQHQIIPGTLLKKTSILIQDDAQKTLQNIVMSETAHGEIELFVDGQLRTRVRDIHSLPVATIFNDKGEMVKEDLGLMMPTFALSK